MTEPVAFFSIFPYIARMVQRNGGLAEADVDLWSGLIESVFSLAQGACLLVWGRLADRLSRKPVLVASLAAMAIGPALFGLASTLGQMLLFRCLAGVFSGSAPIVRTMVADHSTPATQALAFGWFGFAGNVGIVLGPVLGGLLAEPRWLARVAFFARHPYALPGLAVAAVSCALFLDETLDRRRAGEPDR